MSQLLYSYSISYKLYSNKKSNNFAMDKQWLCNRFEAKIV